MVHSSFYIEVAILEGMCAILLPLMVVQLIAYRFTPPKKRSQVKQRILWVGSFVWLLQAIRCIDRSSVFGIFPRPFEVLVGEQVAAFIVDGGVLLLVASARALYSILARPVPTIIPKLYYGIAVSYQCLALGVTLIDVIKLNGPTPDVDLATTARFARIIIFQCMALTILAASWYSLWGLRTQISLFVHALERQEHRMSRAEGVLPGQAKSLTKSTSSSSPDPNAAQPAIEPAHRTPEINTVQVHPSHGHRPSNAGITATPKLAATQVRLAELRLTESKLKKLHILAHVVLLIGFIPNIATVIVPYFQGKKHNYLVDPNLPIEPDEFRDPIAQSIIIFIGVWYCWVDTSVLRNATPSGDRSFWHILKHGAVDVSSPPPTNLHPQPPQIPAGPAFMSPSEACEFLSASLVVEGKPRGQVQLAPSPALGPSRPMMEELVSQAPLDSEASHAPTGLSMRSGLASGQALRNEGDLYTGQSLVTHTNHGNLPYYPRMSTLDHTSSHRPFNITDIAEVDQEMEQRSAHLLRQPSTSDQPQIEDEDIV